MSVLCARGSGEGLRFEDSVKTASETVIYVF